MVVIGDEESYFTDFICNYKCLTFGMYSTVLFSDASAKTFLIWHGIVLRSVTYIYLLCCQSYNLVLQRDLKILVLNSYRSD